MLIGMFVMFVLILFIDYTMIKSFFTQTVPHPGKYNEPRNIFLIPGINEYIPLVWGLIALIVTLVVHEFSHAILCKVEGIKVKSMGILFALLPIGGFAEPDEEQLLGKKAEKEEKEEKEEEEPKKLAKRSERVRILTSGVMANFVTALIAFILFFSLLGSISPVGDVMVTTVIPGSPADTAGVRPEMILTKIDGKEINSAHDFLFYVNTLEQGSKVTLSVVDRKVRKEIELVTAAGNQTLPGVKIYRVIPGSPAQAAGIKPDMVLIRVDNTEIRELDDFITFMNSTKEAQKIDVYVRSNSSAGAPIMVFRGIELAKYPYDPKATKGFLGVSYAPVEGALSHSTGIGIGQFPARNFLSMLQSIPSLLTGIRGWLLLFSLPIFGLTGDGFPGFSVLIAQFYEPTGWAEPLGDGIFLILNALMWIGWMNFYVGLFNCLPAVPLDGGHVFRDVMSSSLSKIMGNGEKVERLSNGITIIFAVMILISLVLVTVGPYAVYGF
jgi:membrane-associated protease RseP (regulator of RpoE activity)